MMKKILSLLLVLLCFVSFATPCYASSSYWINGTVQVGAEPSKYDLSTLIYRNNRIRLKGGISKTKKMGHDFSRGNDLSLVINKKINKSFKLNKKCKFFIATYDSSKGKDVYEPISKKYFRRNFFGKNRKNYYAFTISLKIKNKKISKIVVSLAD